MYRLFEQKTKSGFAAAVGFAIVLGPSFVSRAQSSVTPKPVPDAQVEANVLKALANATDLADQPITTTTVYGVVTLSGSVQTDSLRTEAENLTSRTAGVVKVIDEMTLADASSQSANAQAGGVLMSDGTTAPAGSAQNDASTAQGSPDSDNTAPPQASGPNYGPGAPEYREPYSGPRAPSPDVYAQQNGYSQQQGSPQQNGYPQQRGYPGQPPNNGQYGAQQAGQSVTIPSGAMVRIRINQPLDSGRTQPGTSFDGVVMNDVLADGAVAIPRGATVHGTVIEAKKSGALAGRGEMSLQLTQVTLAGRSYPIVSNIWNHHGGDKTAETVDKTVVGGGIGALFGAAAGGGAGAAIGAGIGGALGLGSSAASGNGQVYVPSEGMLTFQLAQPTRVETVSQQEMNRLAQGLPAGAAGRPMMRRAYPYPGYGPAYYRAYPPYPYPY